MSGQYIVADVGGTQLRAGYVAPGADRVTNARRLPTRGIADGPNGDPQRRVTDQLLQLLGTLVAEAPAPVEAVAVAFAGPVDAAGEVSDAPTVWGARRERLPLAALATAELGRPVHVLNDVTAAGWRYVAREPGDFSIITVSSGLGNKVFCGGEPLVGPYGLGGELGHVRVDQAADAPLCDCGGRGHLAAFASGRGVLARVRLQAAREPDAFARSRLRALCAGDSATLDSEHVAAAIRDGDELAVAVLRRGLDHLALALGTIYAAIGVRRFIVMGGFARAVGPAYLEHLGEALARIAPFGLEPAEIPAMLRMADDDDDDGLLGCARYLDRRSAASPGLAAGGARPSSRQGVPA